MVLRRTVCDRIAYPANNTASQPFIAVCVLEKVNIRPQDNYMQNKELLIPAQHAFCSNRLTLLHLSHSKPVPMQHNEYRHKGNYGRGRCGKVP